MAASASNDPNSGAHLIKRAIELDMNKKYADALVCYREGIDMLIKNLKNINEEEKKAVYREKIKSYMDRAETVKRMVDEMKEAGKYHEQITIEEDSIGNSYETLFAKFFRNTDLEYVEIDDAYIKSPHQIHNFLRFVEMIVKLTSSIKKIILSTTAESDRSKLEVQETRLNEIKSNLEKRRDNKIELIINYNNSLHDREIRLSSGWIIKIGRGLDYFKPPETRDKMCLGLHDYDLRQCYSTTIDIFHKNSIRKSN